jgi:hypothetical protein
MPEIYPPVDLTAFANTIANNPQIVGTDWNLGCYTVMKAFIKNHYSIIQEDFCCYCKTSLRHGGYGEPIEHIVPKDDRPRWMFVPRNLALSCYPCNTKKNADNTLSAAGLGSVNYPTTANGFIIYHPHFNNWDNHFEVFHKYFLKPTSPKGRATFKVCELYRFNLPLDKAKMNGIKEESIRARVLTKIFNDPDATDEIISQGKEISLEIIRRAREKKAILGN